MAPRITTTHDNTVHLATRIAALLPAALQGLHDSRGGYPSSTPGSGSAGGSSGGLPTSPVERQAGRIDRAAIDAAELAREVRVAERALMRVHRIVTAYTSTVHGDAGTVAGGEWCVSHLRLPACEPCYRGDLCRWCYDYRATEGGLPPVALLEARRDNGGKITTDMLRWAKGRKR